MSESTASAGRAESRGAREPIFPPWIDSLFRALSAAGAFGAVYLVLIVTFGFSPKTTDVGYMPEQPVPYSHKLHVGELGLDCRYCHTGVEVGAKAGVPPTQTCMNCHNAVLPEKATLEPIRESYRTGKPVHWLRIHDLSDFAYFNHSAHVNHGVGCVSCHGRIDTMEEVYQAETLAMGWCLDCHRNPAPHLRPQSEITNMSWTPEGEFEDYGERELEARGWSKTRLRELTSCSTCHR